MTIDDLIQRLEEYRDALGGDAEVRLMTQQNWPFENEIVGLASGEEINEPDDGEDEDMDEDSVVFIIEGQQRCYGSKRAWEVAY
ncbi:hypothetical protein Pan97_39690 [Bremerella volcania]|uniref:Uncharacterized protein n=1 Tax=Bremerella volcania TaxID=2527984 RepID=A0A518CCG9_9BACT|nr:hypothetical protein [Bremerella volcania]QDU76912.1 hypothetical protein Pan97_39690 [Bremerella volcania]